MSLSVRETIKEPLIGEFELLSWSDHVGRKLPVEPGLMYDLIANQYHKYEAGVMAERVGFEN
jgi:hypothetical protein